MSHPKVFRVTAGALEASAVAEAARLLRDGGLVAFPTETVYGLGADATNPRAIERLNQVKGRPPDKPYTLLLHSVRQVHALVSEVPPLAARLLERFCPGPITIIIPYNTTRTVGIRIPDHPIAQAFLKACDVPVAAPSANLSGAAPATDAQQVLDGLGSAFDGLLDGGPCRLGRASTVVQVADGHLEVRREGAIRAQEIHDVIGGARSL